MKKERLVILAGKHKDKRFWIGDRLTIGRSAENSIRLYSSAVSRQHAVIKKQFKGTILEDLSSVNGTYVNGEKIKSHKLKPQDIIRVGDIEMKFEVVQKSLKESGHELVQFEDEDQSINLKTNSVNQLFKSFLSYPGK